MELVLHFPSRIVVANSIGECLDNHEKVFMLLSCYRWHKKIFKKKKDCHDWPDTFSFKETVSLRARKIIQWKNYPISYTSVTIKSHKNIDEDFITYAVIVNHECNKFISR